MISSFKIKLVRNEVSLFNPGPGFHRLRVLDIQPSLGGLLGFVRFFFKLMFFFTLFVFVLLCYFLWFSFYGVSSRPITIVIDFQRLTWVDFFFIIFKIQLFQLHHSKFDVLKIGLWLFFPFPFKWFLFSLFSFNEVISILFMVIEFVN